MLHERLMSGEVVACAIGLAAIGASLCWGAWCEYRTQNQRDGQLMAACGAALVAGGAAVPYLF
jgi:hypothetical protein